LWAINERVVFNKEMMDLIEVAGRCKDFGFGAFQIQFYKIDAFRQKVIQRYAVDLHRGQSRDERDIQPSRITRMRKKLFSAALPRQGTVFKGK
jgi:hypothetical protein